MLSQIVIAMKKLSLYVFLVLMVLINISYSGEKKIESAFGIKLDISWIAYTEDIEKWNPDWCEENTISIYDKELTKDTKDVLDKQLEESFDKTIQKFKVCLPL